MSHPTSPAPVQPSPTLHILANPNQILFPPHLSCKQKVRKISTIANPLLVFGEINHVGYLRHSGQSANGSYLDKYFRGQHLIRLVRIWSWQDDTAESHPIKSQVLHPLHVFRIVWRPMFVTSARVPHLLSCQQQLLYPRLGAMRDCPIPYVNHTHMAECGKQEQLAHVHPERSQAKQVHGSFPKHRLSSDLPGLGR